MNETASLLRQAFAAQKNGETALARQLLLQVVQSEERNEQAWLALSDLVEDPHDVRICLENALTLNPRNTFVRMRLASLCRQLGEAPSPLPASSPRAGDGSSAVRFRTGVAAAPGCLEDGPLCLGQYLVRHCGLDPAGLTQALERQAELRASGSQRLLGQILLEMGLASQDELRRALRYQQEQLNLVFRR